MLNTLHSIAHINPTQAFIYTDSKFYSAHTHGHSEKSRISNLVQALRVGLFARESLPGFHDVAFNSVIY